MQKTRNLLLISSSRSHGYGYLETASNEIKDLLNSKNVKTVLFIPYALKDHDKYLQRVAPPFKSYGFQIKSIHQYESTFTAINEAEAIAVGGGNTFRLLKTLYDFNLIEPIRERVAKGVPYIGWSAGSNVATVSINTTNDMPIVHPPTFNALGLVPFNINPHYVDADPNSTHRGETRDERILEYLELPEAKTVVGLREGAMLRVEGMKMVLKGTSNARLFIKNEKAVDYNVGSDMSFLLEESK